VKAYSRREIERLANELRESCGEISVPVDVETIARHLGAQVHVSAFSDDLSGVLIRRKGQTPTIAVNGSQSPLRRRFTIAHECGHLALEHDGEVFIDKAVLNKRDARSSLAVSEPEVQANQFAASLLMPREDVVRYMEHFLRSYNSHAVLVEVMASTFRVSKSAMAVRLVNLGLTSPDDDH
jgi:Zn-dependent peptidase ImmA (M78 family)